MKIEVKANCPLHGFQPCKQMECAWFTQLRGKNPNTGQDVDEWGCAVAWLPMLMIEVGMHQRQSGAAIDSMRNEIVKRMDGALPEPNHNLALEG